MGQTQSAPVFLPGRYARNADVQLRERLRTLKSRGRDVGTILMEEGLAVPFVCGATRCPKTPRPWC
jgi:hypothetical protein